MGCGEWPSLHTLPQGASVAAVYRARWTSGLMQQGVS